MQIPDPSFMGLSHSEPLSPALITSLLGTLLQWLTHAGPNLLTLPDSPFCESHSTGSRPLLPPLPLPSASGPRLRLMSIKAALSITTTS